MSTEVCLYGCSAFLLCAFVQGRSTKKRSAKESFLRHSPPLWCPSQAFFEECSSFISKRMTTKLLQKSEMRKDIVIELSYKGFSWSGDNSWSHYNPCRSQILTPQRYLFVTMPENATNGHGGRNKTLRNSELPTTHAKNPVTEKDCAVPLRFAYRHRTLHQLILKPKN